MALFKDFGFQYSVFLNHFQFDILENRDLSKKWRKLYGTDMERNVSGGKSSTERAAMPNSYQEIEVLMDFETEEIVTLGELTPKWWI